MRTDHLTRSERLARRLHEIFLLLLVLVTTLHVSLVRRADDAFHEGEYLMYAVPGEPATDARTPVYRRGGVEHIPSRIASVICLADRQIVCVREINTGLTVVAGLLFVWLLAMIAGIATIRGLIAGIPAMGALIYQNGSAANPVDLQQGVPGPNDLFVLLTLAVVVWLIRNEEHLTERMALAWVSVFAFVAGFGLFWSYDQGVVALVLAAATIVGLRRLWQAVRPYGSLIGGGALGFGLAALTGIYGDTGANFANIWYWLNNGGIAWMPWSSPMLVYLAPAILLGIALLSSGAFLVRQNIRATEPGQSMILILLMITTVLYAIQAIPRPDAQHIGRALGIASLLAAAVLRQAGLPWTLGGGRSTVVLVASAVAVLIISGYGPRPFESVPGVWARGLLANAEALSTSPPLDTDLVSPGLREAADIIRARAPRCTYSFSNEGLLYLLAKTPSCSRFAYPIYVSQAMQRVAIAELERANPPMVLGRSDAWSNTVDGIGLAIRTPQLDAWLNERYPTRRTLQGGYELRMRDMAAKGSR